MLFKENKNKDDNGVIVLKKTEPGMCGGTDATRDTRAPTEIISEDMTLFHATSALPVVIVSPGYDSDEDTLTYASAFAAPSGEGTFLFLEYGGDHRKNPERTGSWSFVKEDIFPSLVKLVRECGIAKNNGFHSTTHGLPRNFGGSIDIRYASEERISISDNRSPVLSLDAARRIVELFKTALLGEKIDLPDVAALNELRFEENRENGGFTKAVLKISPDGRGTNEKRSRCDDGTIYESVKNVNADTVAEIKANIENTGVLAWADLPDSDYPFGKNKTITFVFDDGRTITVRGGKILPDQIQSGFFNIEFEMTIKN